MRGKYVRTAETREKLSLSMKGKTRGYIYGPQTPEHRKKIGEASRRALTGRRLSEAHKAKIRATSKISGMKKRLLTGPLSPGWKGGKMTQNHKERSIFNRRVKPLVLERDSNICQKCGQAGGYLHADHIKSWADYPELRFDIDNCRTLCMACHYFVTFNRPLPKGVSWGHSINYAD